METFLASLLDLGEPAVVPFAAALGYFVASALGRLRGEDPEARREREAWLTFVAVGAAICAWLFGTVTGLY